MFLFVDELGEITRGSYTEATDIEVANDFFSVYPSYCWSVVDGVVTLKVDADTILADKLALEETNRLEEVRKASIPPKITPRQLRLALLGANLLDAVEAMVATDRAMGIWWEYSLDIERDNEFIISSGTALGLTERDIDNLFIGAKDL